jgi:transposase
LRGGLSKRFQHVAVPPDRDSEAVRRFYCFTQDLHAMADWLKQCGIVTVAMQSTGVYWLPVYEILVERGFEVFLVNARHTKNLPGRKSDVLTTSEAAWFCLSGDKETGNLRLRAMSRVDEAAYLRAAARFVPAE